MVALPALAIGAASSGASPRDGQPGVSAFRPCYSGGVSGQQGRRPASSSSSPLVKRRMYGEDYLLDSVAAWHAAEIVVHGRGSAGAGNDQGAAAVSFLSSPVRGCLE